MQCYVPSGTHLYIPLWLLLLLFRPYNPGHHPPPQRQVPPEHHQIPRHTQPIPADANLAALDLVPPYRHLGDRQAELLREEEELDVE